MTTLMSRYPTGRPQKRGPYPQMDQMMMSGMPGAESGMGGMGSLGTSMSMSRSQRPGSSAGVYQNQWGGSAPPSGAGSPGQPQGLTRPMQIGPSGGGMGGMGGGMGF